MIRVIGSIIIAILLLAGQAQSGEVTEKNEVTKSLKFGDPQADGKTIMVDNVNGSIHVSGYDGSTVELIAHVEYTADSKKKLEEAKRDVTLDIKEEDERILIYVDGPWRRSNGSCDYRGSEYYGYEVVYDFEIKIPRKTGINLKTVNQGTIKAENIEGAFTVRHVNGNVRLYDMNGSGSVSTVNGKIEVTFKENPLRESSFKTVNGTVDVKFRDKLSADLEFKTLNGEVYSDFEMQSLPMKPHRIKQHGSMKVYKSGESFSVRVGSGGPELSFDTLNGDITVSKYE